VSLLHPTAYHGIKSYNSSQGHNLNFENNNHIHLLETENMFSQALQFGEFDLAQYNSPSFATANHLMSNYQSLSKQMQQEMSNT
jgi:hypothetical protein